MSPSELGITTSKVSLLWLMSSPITKTSNTLWQLNSWPAGKPAGQSSCLNSTWLFISTLDTSEWCLMLSQDTRISIPKRRIRTMLILIHITSALSLLKNSLLCPYKLLTSLLWYSRQALFLMLSNSMLTSSPHSPLIPWPPFICPCLNPLTLIGKSTLMVFYI